MSTTCLVSILPLTLSNIRPARIATVVGAGGHAYMPPQGSTHGATGPTPRQGPGLTVGAGVSGAWPAFETCARSAGETNKTPTIPSVTVNTNLHRITEPS